MENLFESSKPYNHDDDDICKKCKGEGAVTLCCGAFSTINGTDAIVCAECEEEADMYICKVCNGTGFVVPEKEAGEDERDWFE